MKALATLSLLLFFGTSGLAKDVKAEIRVSGMTCGGCAVSVKSALTKVEGVKSAEVSHEKGLAVVVYDDTKTNAQQLREAINKTGFKAEPSRQDRR
jgi:periplasmic mercuric ion binding protein